MRTICGGLIHVNKPSGKKGKSYSQLLGRIGLIGAGLAAVPAAYALKKGVINPMMAKAKNKLGLNPQPTTPAAKAQQINQQQQQLNQQKQQLTQQQQINQQAPVEPQPQQMPVVPPVPPQQNKPI